MAKRNFFILFNMDGSNSRGRTGYSVSRGPKKVCTTTGIDTGVMWGQLCYRSDENSNAYVGVTTEARPQDDGKVKLVLSLKIPSGAKVTTFSDGSSIIDVVSTYTP